MRKGLLWQADNKPLELTYKKGKTPLSHRCWPGEPVPPVTHSLIQTLEDEWLLHAGHKDNITWCYENCSTEWQSAINQVISLLGEPKPSIPARSMALLTHLARTESPELLDEIVEKEGLEYATMVVIERQMIVVYCHYSAKTQVNITQPQPMAERYYETGLYHSGISAFEMRLRKHLSLANEKLWQRCANRLVTAIPFMRIVRQPFIALLLPEFPHIAHGIVNYALNQQYSCSSLEWLKSVATNPEIVTAIDEYWSLDVFSDRKASEMYFENAFGYAACAALLREQGLAAIPRLAAYAHKEDCGSLLAQIDHPLAIRTLLLVADKNKASVQRVVKYGKKFPHATLAALAELLALKEPPTRPGYPIIEEKKRPQQQKAREESWQALLQTLIAKHPQLIEQVKPWLSEDAQAVLAQIAPTSLQAVRVDTETDGLPTILVSPPWRSRKKKSTVRRFNLPELTTKPQQWWPVSISERLKSHPCASYFSAMPFAERITSKGTLTVLQELGFEYDDWLFKYHIHPGKLEANRKLLLQQFSFSNSMIAKLTPEAEDPELNEARQALEAQDSQALINAWLNYYTKHSTSETPWNLYLLAQLPRKMAAECWQLITANKCRFVGHDYLLNVLGTDALPGLLTGFAHQPKEFLPLLIHFGANELALPVARIWRRYAAGRNLARQWIFQWPEHVAGALIPHAVGKPGDNREAALAALRLLYQHGHTGVLQTVASRWEIAGLWAALEKLLTQNPLDNYPARISSVPDFWHPNQWRRPRLISNDQPLADEALEIVGEMLRFTQGGHFYCGLEQLKTTCQPQTLAAFAWDLFMAWQHAGAPAKENWAFLALGILGDESTARDLTALILAWPQEGKSARAASGLNILTQIGNDMALVQLQHISQRAKSRSLRDSALAYIQLVAENRGLSQEELADRLVPTLGLDDTQALTFDFGPRQFYVRFDENLTPVIYDQQNVRQKSVPRLRADDDPLVAPEALARLKGLKKDATQVSKSLLASMEVALRTARRWMQADFQSLFVSHPFTRMVTQRLVWGVYPSDEPRRLLTAFHMSTAGEFCNAQNEPITLPTDALIGIAHPLEMSAEMRNDFEQLFAAREILPPLMQLTRHTVQLASDEAASHSLTRWQGKTATIGQLLGMRNKGWEQRGEDSFCYDVAQYRLVLQISPGFYPYNIDAKAPMNFSSLRIYRDGEQANFSELSEYDLCEALSVPELIFQ